MYVYYIYIYITINQDWIILVGKIDCRRMSIICHSSRRPLNYISTYPEYLRVCIMYTRVFISYGIVFYIFFNTYVKKRTILLYIVRGAGQLKKKKSKIKKKIRGSLSSGR